MLEADYLVVGAGALGMVFVDELLNDPEARIVMVDRRHAAGGHWLDAYPFVRLHQPSAFYGVGSRPLGSGRRHKSGPNAGCYEMASGAEVCAHFDAVMRDRFLPSGRVIFLGMSEHAGEGQVRNLLTGATTQVRHRKLVDATYFHTSIPATHTRGFEADDGVTVVTPNALPNAAPGRRRFCVLGGGKTGMDACMFLLEGGAPPEAIRWVVPRASWCLNRETVQPGGGVLAASEAAVLEAAAGASSSEDLFDRLEAVGEMHRIHPEARPVRLRNAILSRGEAKLLAGIGDVVRKGRVKRIEKTRIVMEQGETPAEAGDLYVDCTASAINPGPVIPVFQGARITIQTLRSRFVCLSAALIARVERMNIDEEQKNMLCRPLPMPRSMEDFPLLLLRGLEAAERWNAHPVLREWIVGHRLAGAGFPDLPADGPEAVRIRERIAAARPAAVRNLERLVGV
ncbi:MAG: NAD(P)/FAD-dependent oxidoreductase [Hyphomonadaceae bacterium]